MKPAKDSRRIYAIGDVHGRADLLDVLLGKITEDCAGQTDPVPLIFLGDYVDRGLDSRAVIDRLLAIAEQRVFAPRFLKGNHEAAMLDFLTRPELGSAWLAYGGAETLYSYGVKAPAMGAPPETLQRAAEKLKEKLPPEHLRFLEGLELWIQYGSYLFVHAGLNPNRSLEQQSEQDLLTIRDAFLRSRKQWPFTIVHGHTPEDAVHIDRRRIGVDTGAYVSGRLSAVRLEGDDVRVLAT